MKPGPAAIVLLLPLGAAHGQPPPGAEAEAPAAATRASEADALVGAWSGQWTAEGDRRRGPAELIVLRGVSADVVIGQFTFISGAHVWTARHEGTVVDVTTRFPLPGGGEIVVRVAAPSRVTGEFHAPSGTLPAKRGVLELTPAR